MDKQTLEIKATIQIAKPASEVFEAIVDPAKMANYFIAEGSGRMETGKELVWKFPEFEEQAPVKVLTTKENSFVSFEWDGSPRKKTRIAVSLTSVGNATVVTVTEGAMENTDDGIKWLKGNTEGWANFLACLKAYLEYGINLRKGAFDFMRKKVG